ncbi:DUF4190 domain-containing protein [Streptomyces sp. KMM 9044]|nr:DUF4190 domain-containing protein [Streptomyces sp. KMM 9044]WAX78151.1 DUF4190 domain-containing protein [Streptomyces sp. KMM 9044]
MCPARRSAPAHAPPPRSSTAEPGARQNQEHGRTRSTAEPGARHPCPYPRPPCPSSPRAPRGSTPRGSNPIPRPQGPYAPSPFSQGPYGLRPPPRFNGLAVASLVLGLLWFVPVVGLVLGIVALGQLRRRGEQGRGMARGGIVMSSVSLVTWILLAALLAVFWDELDEVPVTGGTGVHTFADGDCFDSPGGLVGWATEADRVSCEGEHDGEVLGTVRLPDGPSPGDDSLFDTAGERCYGLEDAYAMDGGALPADVDV